MPADPSSPLAIEVRRIDAHKLFVSVIINVAHDDGIEESVDLRVVVTGEADPRIEALQQAALRRANALIEKLLV